MSCLSEKPLPWPPVCRPPQFSQDAPPPRPPPSDDHDDVEYDNDRYGRDRYDRGGRGRGGYGRDADPAAAADEAARALGAEAVLAANRARIYRITTAPDQLNPRGGVDASLTLFAPDQVGTWRGRTAAQNAIDCCVTCRCGQDCSDLVARTSGLVHRAGG